MELVERRHVQVYRYCVTLACGDEAVARSATVAAVRGVAGRGPGEDGPVALFALARAAVKAELRLRKGATPPGDGATAALFAARPALEEQHWSLLALALPEYADRPRHRQVDLTGVAAALGRKVDVTRKAVDRLVEPGGHLDVALFTADAAAGGTDCPELAAIVTGAKRLRPTVRKAVAAHLPACAACTAAREGRPPALAVLSAVPVPAVPDDLAALDDPAAPVPPPPDDLATPEDASAAAPADVSAAAPEHVSAAAPDAADAASEDAADAADAAPGDTTDDAPGDVADGLFPEAAHGAGTPVEDSTVDDLTEPELEREFEPAEDHAAREPGDPAAPSAAPAARDDSDDTVELLPVAAADDERPPATVYYPVPAVAGVRLPLLRRPPVLLAALVAVLAVVAGAGFLGVRGGSRGLAGAAAAPSVTVTAIAAPPAALSPPAVGVSGSAGAGRTPAASGQAKLSASPSMSAGPVSAGVVAPLVPAADRLREVLPLLVRAPGCPGQTFGGSCYSVQPFTLPLSVAIPAGFDEARLADALQWTVRAQTMLGPVEFRGRGNHARVTVTDGGQATPPTVWTVQAALTVGGETYLSNEVTLRVYATTT